mmetsp:Transcript_82376/g.223216  ORF Transcript_82376/g.223216 Transcript_82376/m.223216 type:complete len:212 (-) Transcript_82376:351-986(-)
MEGLIAIERCRRHSAHKVHTVNAAINHIPPSTSTPAVRRSLLLDRTGEMLRDRTPLTPGRCTSRSRPPEGRWRSRGRPPRARPPRRCPGPGGRARRRPRRPRRGPAGSSAPPGSSASAPPRPARSLHPESTRRAARRALLARRPCPAPAPAPAAASARPARATHTNAGSRAPLASRRPPRRSALGGPRGTCGGTRPRSPPRACCTAALRDR